jgi:hypothetical protein
MTDPERYRVEQQVIGLCLSGRHMACIDILKPQHFSDEFHRRLFTLIIEMANTESIDIITVSRRYTLKHKELRAGDITEIQMHCLGKSEHTYSLLLLEIDIREKFTSLIQGYEEASVKENDFESAAIWKQCREYLSSTDTDIFEGVDKIYTYLKSYKPDEVLEYEEMMQAIPKMVDRIKRTAQTFLLIENLERNACMQGKREELFKITTNILITLMVAGEVPKDLENYLKHIQNHIL